MKRLRHPVRAIREPFGKAGLTIAVLALVLAMVGGAYAAGGGLSGKQKKEVEKISKKFAGKPGAPGPTGPTGPQGLPAANGTKGEKGEKGDNGTGVTGTPIATSSTTCNHQGGVAYTSASGTENVCNGQTGFVEALPEGKTMTGEWTIMQYASGTGFLEGDASTSISFPFPLSTAPAGVYINVPATVNLQCEAKPEEEEVAGVIKHPRAECEAEQEEKQEAVEEEEAERKAHCPGSVSNPGADEGYLCVFARAPELNVLVPATTGATPQGPPRSSVAICPVESWAQCLYSGNFVVPAQGDRFGAFLSTETQKAGLVTAAGSWAVTAE